MGRIAPEQLGDNNLSPDEVFHILWDKGYAINGKTDLKGRVGDAEFIDEAIGFTIEGHSCLVISYNSVELAEDAASQDGKKRTILSSELVTTFRIKKTVITINPSDEAFAKEIERVLILNQ